MKYLAGCFLIFNAALLSSASAIVPLTWGAIGLPPGLSIKALANNKAQIIGNPTMPGFYQPVIYPMTGMLAGDMESVNIAILPKGVSLPIYSGYARTIPANGLFSPVAIGAASNAILCCYQAQNGEEKITYTTNGVNFTDLDDTSVKFSSIYGNATLGGRTLFIDWQALAYADNFGALQRIPWFNTTEFPAGVVSDGNNGFYCATYTVGYYVREYLLYKSSTGTSWKLLRNFFNATNGFSFSPIMSIGVNGNSQVMAIGEGSSESPISELLLLSSDGGATWATNSTNPGIASVAYGNGAFVGTGAGGVWTSTNGMDWMPSCSINFGAVTYSSAQQLFFAGFGVSSNGVTWMPYDHSVNAAPSAFGLTNKPACASTGLIFIGNQELFTNTIPHASVGTDYSGTVGKAFNCSFGTN